MQFPRDGQVLSRGFGEECSLGIEQGGGGQEQAIPPVRHQFSPGDDVGLGAGGSLVADIQFRAIGQVSGGDPHRPNHDLVEDGRDEATVNGLGETAPFLPETEARFDDLAVGFEANLESGRIVDSADEAVPGGRKRVHG